MPTQPGEQRTGTANEPRAGIETDWCAGAHDEPRAREPVRQPEPDAAQDQVAPRAPAPRAATSLKLQLSAPSPGRRALHRDPGAPAGTAALRATASRGQVSVTVRVPPAERRSGQRPSWGSTALAAWAEAGSAAMTTRIERRTVNLSAIRHATTGLPPGARAFLCWPPMRLLTLIIAQAGGGSSGFGGGGGGGGGRRLRRRRLVGGVGRGRTRSSRWSSSGCSAIFLLYLVDPQRPLPAQAARARRSACGPPRPRPPRTTPTSPPTSSSGTRARCSAPPRWPGTPATAQRLGTARRRRT